MKDDVTYLLKKLFIPNKTTLKTSVDMFIHRSVMQVLFSLRNEVNNSSYFCGKHFQKHSSDFEALHSKIFFQKPHYVGA